MAADWIRPDGVFDGAHLLSDRALRFEAGRLAAIVPAAEAPEDAPRAAGIVSAPLVDLQVNGGGNVLFNTDPTPEGIAGILAAHRALGTGWLLPTVITDAPDVMERAADAVIAAWGMEGLLGIHIEGPHLDPRKRGTHETAFLRPFDSRTLRIAQRLRARGIPVLLTLAPEAVAPGDIAALAALGVIVSLGHSAASHDAARAALAEGARAFTHLFNAMSPMEGRAPGMVGAAILSEAHVGIICDGVHVADEMVALALRARPRPGLGFLVSDAMPTVGGADSFTLYGRKIFVRDGRLVNSEGSLAGAHTTMAEGVSRLHRRIGLPMAEALEMAITVPLALVGRPELGSPLGLEAGRLLWWREGLAG